MAMTGGLPGPWVEQWLSAARFQTYLTEAGGDRRLALDLYEWNTAMAATVLHDLAHVEVAVRNAYNDALVARQPGLVHWTSDELRYFPIRWRTANNGRRYDENATPGSRSPMHDDRRAGERHPTRSLPS